MKLMRFILVLLFFSSFSLSYISAQESNANEVHEDKPEEIWKDKWPEIFATYNAISDPRHRLIFSNYMHRKIGSLSINPADEYFIYNPRNEAVFEMKTSLAIPVPVLFLTEEIKQYDRFFWDHVKAFLPMEVNSTSYNPETKTLTVVVMNPDLPGEFGKIDLNFIVTTQGNNHVLTLDPGEIAKIGGIKDNTITITVEQLSGSTHYSVVTFHSITHYKSLWKTIEDVKESLNVFKLEDFLFKNMERLCLETEVNVTKKYGAVTNQEVSGLMEFLKQDFIHYDSMVAADAVITAKRNELLTRLNELKQKILETGILEHFVAYNKLVLSGVNQKQKAVGTDWLDDYFPLFEGKRIQDLFLDDKESEPSLWAEAALYDAELADMTLLPYARRITTTYQLDNFRSLIKSGYTSSIYYQEASLTDNMYAGGAFETVIQNEPFRYGDEPALLWFEIAQRVNQEYNFSAFVYLERWYPKEMPHAAWRRTILKESLTVNNPHSLRAFKAMINLKSMDDELFILATRVTTESQADQFEILTNEEVQDIKAYEKVLENIFR